MYELVCDISALKTTNFLRDANTYITHVIYVQLSNAGSLIGPQSSTLISKYSVVRGL